MNRMEFLKMTAAASVASKLPEERQGRRVKAIVFDGFVLFDARSVVKRAEAVLPGKGEEFATRLRVRQFEYTWLRTVGQRYVDFVHVTQNAMDFVLADMRLSLSAEKRGWFLQGLRELEVWADVPQALATLHERGIKMAFLSDFSAEMIDANLERLKLRQYFEPHLTTDRVRQYKPSPVAYQMGPDALGLKKEEMVFAAFGAWDAAGAKWFGYPTVWANRFGVTEEELDVHPDLVTRDMAGLLRFVGIGA